jgi:hypothetical protein
MPVAQTTAPLPANLRQALRAELRRASRPPYETPSVVMLNGLLVLGCWTLLPTAAVDALFSFTGPLGFPMVLAVWMYSDVPATNLLGADAVRTVAALPDPGMLRRMWYAKNIVLWLLATPPGVLAAVAIGSYEHQPVGTVLTIGWIALVPPGSLGFAGWLGIWFPYHPIPLRYRWAQRRRWWPMLGRWLLLVLAPYSLVPLLVLAVTLPTLMLWYAGTGGGPDRRISDPLFGWGLLMAAGVAGTAWLVGHWYGARRASLRRERLTGFLTDPDRG